MSVSCIWSEDGRLFSSPTAETLSMSLHFFGLKLTTHIKCQNRSRHALLPFPTLSVVSLSMFCYLLSCVQLCNPVDCSPPGFSAYEILQARILEWVATTVSEYLPDPGIQPASFMSPTIGRQAHYH